MLLSQATFDLARDSLPADILVKDLGDHRLKDLQRSERVFQLRHADVPDDFPPLRAADEVPNNLATDSTPLVGRAREVEEVTRLLRSTEVRLLTLSGPGGSGKTRLALRVAADLLDVFPGGVYFVPLAAVSDPDLLAPTVARALGIPEARGKTPFDALKDYLRDLAFLLVLDNFEQLVDAAPIVAELLTAAAQTKILVTSRTLLHVSREWHFPVPPLSLPDSALHEPPERIMQYEAVRLFGERARAARPDFVLTPDNLPAVAALCRRLDGLPLAIELAAARVRVLTPAAIAARLESSAGGLPLLTGGARDLPARQQTLRNAIAWSYDLLTESERTVFRRLGVFVGGWPLEAAEAVCADEISRAEDAVLESAEVMDTLAALLDHSLVQRAAQGASDLRYSMLETIREFAVDRLRESGEAERIGRRHAEHYLALAEEAEPHLRGADQVTWLDTLQHEHGNLRAALLWYEERNLASPALRLAGALWQFWWLRGHLTGGRQRLRAVLYLSGAEEPTLLRAKVLHGAGVLAHFHQVMYWPEEVTDARSLLGESLAIARALGDQLGACRSLAEIGRVAYDLRDYGAAQAPIEESLAIARELGDTRGLAETLYHQCYAGFMSGFGRMDVQADLEAARHTGEEALAHWRRTGDRWGTGWTLLTLGRVAEKEGFLGTAGANVRARALFEEALDLLGELGDRLGRGFALIFLPIVLTELGEYTLAHQRHDERLRLAEQLGDRRTVAWTLWDRAILAADEGDLPAARADLVRSLDAWRKIGQAHEHGIAYVVEGAAYLAAVEGRAARAQRLEIAAQAHLERLNQGPLRMLRWRQRVGARLSAIRSRVSDQEWRAAAEIGGRMSLAEALADALTGLNG